MDITLAKTFLEIVASGSFIAAATRLNITQTAVSARVRSLEDYLGRRLFVRNKSGARLTPAGERFVRHAATLVQVWERARQQVALPAGRVEVASVGAELSLWNPFLTDWLVWMRRECPDIALRAEVDSAHRLLERVQEGTLDMAVLYTPTTQNSDLVVELLDEERLVMVTTAADATWREEDFVFIDWGGPYTANQQAAFPMATSPSVSVSLGPLGLAFLLSAGGTGYFRSGAVTPYLNNGRLKRVAGAPEFAHAIHLVYSRRSDADLIDRIRSGFQLSGPL